MDFLRNKTLTHFKPQAFLTATFVIFLLQNLMETNVQLITPDSLKPVFGLIVNVLIWPLFLGGALAVILDYYRNDEETFQFAKFIRYAIKNYLRILFINLFMIIAAILISLPFELMGYELNDMASDIILIPISIIKLFWTIAIIQEKRFFRSLKSSFDILIRNRQALILSILYAAAGFADTAVPRLLSGDLTQSTAIVVSVVRALVFGTAIFYAYYVGTVIYGDFKELRSSGMPAHTQDIFMENEDDRHKPGMLLIAASFIPIVGIITFIKGITSLKKVEQFSIRPLAACVLGAFFTLVHAFMAIGLLLPKRDILTQPGDSFLYEPSQLVSGLLFIVILLVLFTTHEYAHAYAAWKLGDDTPLEEGRLTLNPIPHLDLFGSILLPGIMIFQQSDFIFGWAKPVHVNLENMKDPKRDNIRVSIAGPSINVLMSLVTFIFILLLALIARIAFPEVQALNLAEPYAPVSIAGTSANMPLATLFYILKQVFYTSLILGFFNLLPIPPLDGSHILSAILPDKAMNYFERFRGIGSILFLLLVISPVFDYILMIPMGIFWAVLQFALTALGMG